MDNDLVMVMPYKAFTQKAAAEGFRVCAIWDPALGPAMPTGAAGFPAYLAELETLVDELVLTDFTDPEQYATAIRKAAATTDPAAVYHVGMEASMLTAYRVAEELGLAVNPPRAVELLNDKLAMRALLREHGVSAVRYATAENWQAVAELLPEFTLPVVVKPARLNGSRAVLLLRERAELTRWGELLESYGYHGPVLVEEYLRGPEFSVETISVDGVHHVVGVTRKLLGPPPLFVETGHVHPVTDPQRCTEIAELTRTLLDLAGYRTGPAHTEVIWTERGPRIVESQARLGGDRIPQLVELATGVDIERAIFRALKGHAPSAPDRELVARVHFFSFPPGELLSVRGLEAVRELDFVAELSFKHRPGDTLPSTVDSKSRHGHVLVLGADERQARQRLEQVLSMIEVTTGGSR